LIAHHPWRKMYRIIVECDRARTVQDALRVQPQPKPCGNIARLPRELPTAARTAMAIIISCPVPHCHNRPSRLQNLRDLMPCNHQFARLVSSRLYSRPTQARVPRLHTLRKRYIARICACPRSRHRRSSVRLKSSRVE
jgi:hypothetical protein